MPQAFTVTRKEFTDLFNQVRALWSMTVEGGTDLAISKSFNGVSIRKNKRSSGLPRRDFELRPVAIVEEVGDEDTSLTVREVNYADTPPGSDLIFVEDSFVAYPYRRRS